MSSLCSHAIPASHRGADPDGRCWRSRASAAPYGIKRLNHGIGFNTAAIELLLPTYGERLGSGQDRHALGTQSASDADPGHRIGWVEQIHSFGGEVGMEDTSAPADIYFTGVDGSLRSTARDLPDCRPLCLRHVSSASTLQIDLWQPPSTVTTQRIAASAAQHGQNWHGRRHPSAPGCWPARRLIPTVPLALRRGRKLVAGDRRDVRRQERAPTFVGASDAIDLAGEAQPRSQPPSWSTPMTSPTS